MAIPLRGASLAGLAAAFGGEVRGRAALDVGRFVPIEEARAGDLAPFVRGSLRGEAARALARGAALLVTPELDAQARTDGARGSVWVHSHAAWAMAKVLAAHAVVTDDLATLAPDAVLGAHVSLAPRVVVGARVTIGASSVIGSPGFGWATGPGGEVVRVPQLGGVVLEDDVAIGPLVTVDAGTLAPTIVRRGAKLDAHVHVGHNCDIGEGTLVAAQCGFAGSVRVGKGVLIGGQAGFADHVTVGDGARVAAKSGVIGDVPAGAVFAGYPAVPRARWLRGLAAMYRRLRLNESSG